MLDGIVLDDLNRPALDPDQCVVPRHLALGTQVMPDQISQGLVVLLEFLNLLSQVEDNLNTSQIDTEIPGQGDNCLKPIAGHFIVQTSVTPRASRIEQSLSFPQPQGLGVNTVAFCHPGDHSIARL